MVAEFVKTVKGGEFFGS